MKKINKFMIIGIICVITGLSVVNSLTGHGIRNNPWLNAWVLGTSTGTNTSTSTQGNVVTCFSQGEDAAGASFWDCGFCRFQMDRRAVGDSRTCRATED